MARLNIDILEGIGRELVLSNRELFETEFREGVRRNLTRADMVRRMEILIGSAASIEMKRAEDAISNKGFIEAYRSMAWLGFDLYVNGDMSTEDARALVNANYDAFKSKSSAGAKPRGSNACKPKGSKASKPKTSRNIRPPEQPRKANGQFAKKPKSKGSKGARR